jgi:hypothetical protein
MSRLRIQLLAATALAATAALAGGTAASASAAARPQAQTQARPRWIAAYDYGTGPTAQAAQHAATVALHGDYFGCNTPTLVYDDQLPDGTWTAEVAAACEGYN